MHMNKLQNGAVGSNMPNTPINSSKSIENIFERYDLVCGLEIHAELKTKSKMFCGCVNDPFHAPKPNMYTCPVCLGMPGGLPVPNKTAIEWVIKLGLALESSINRFSKFDRKNYFYPDLAKGYQISQFDIPFCAGGVVETPEGNVNLTRIHLEEDTGKLLHTELAGKKVSLLDFNRSGVPLVEIVSEPDITTPSHASAYGKAMRKLMRYLEIADCDMEQGGMRLEANISLKPKGQHALPNYKVEVKNINSFKFLEQAITFEVVRQAELLDSGTIPTQETRGFRPNSGVTFSQRLKESAADYRYFPDPDIPPIRFSQQEIDNLAASLPTAQAELAAQWQTLYGIDAKSSTRLATSATLGQFWTSVWELDPKQAQSLANAVLNKKLVVTDFSDPAAVIAAFKAQTAKETVPESEMQAAVSRALAANQDAVQKFKSGETKVIGFLIGQVIQHLGKKVDPRSVSTALMIALKN